MLNLLSYYSTTLTLFTLFYLLPAALAVWWWRSGWRNRRKTPVVKTKKKPKAHVEKYGIATYIMCAIFPTFYIGMTVWSLFQVVFIDHNRPYNTCRYESVSCD